MSASAFVGRRPRTAGPRIARRYWHASHPQKMSLPIAMQASPELVGHTLVAHEHESGLEPHGFGTHSSCINVTGPPMWWRHTNPGVHCVDPQGDAGAQFAVSSDHAPLMQVAVVSDPSCGH